MLQTDTQAHTSNMAMLMVYIVNSFPYPKTNHYLAFITVLSVCVRWLHMLNHLTDCLDIRDTFEGDVGFNFLLLVTKIW